MKNIMVHKGYYGTVEYTEEDGVFFGKIIGISDRITYEGDSVKSLKEDFMQAVDDYFEFCKEVGKAPEKPCKGKITVRLEPSLHRQALVYSQFEGKSLNRVMEDALANYINAERSLVPA